LVDGSTTIEFPLVSAEELEAEAWAAMARHDFDAALSHWHNLRQHFPERPEGHVWPIQVLWQDGRLDEAEAMASEAFARFPEHPELLVQYAWIAMQRRQWDEALRWWGEVRRHAPERPEGHVWPARALWQAERLDEAEAAAAEAVRRLPGNADALAEAALVAVAREDWPAATARLNQARAGHHDPVRFDASFGWIVQRVRTRTPVGEQTGLPQPGNPVAETAIEGLSDADLLLSFESLGERCDFGAVQRHYGVEPLGLLRFAYSKFDALLAALDDRFAAIGTLEDTGFERWQDETILSMKKYGLIFHTFVYQDELAAPGKREAFEQQQRRRLTFLKNKLIADLEEPRKIFVYSNDQFTAAADVARLFAALCAYGPNSLLYVRPADADHPPGTVEPLQAGLFAGYYERLTDFLKGEQPPFALWRQLCARTYRLVHGEER
jgi:tetratricopeptide (TPR) repeat protein